MINRGIPAVLALLALLYSCQESAPVKKEQPVTVKEPTVDELVFDSVTRITRGVTNPSFQLIVDDIYLENSRVLTPMSFYIKDMILATCLDTGLVKIVQSFKDFQSITNEKLLAYQTDAEFDGILQMNYYIEDGAIRLTMKLNRGETRDMLAAASMRLPLSALPKSLSYRPDNYDQFKNNGQDTPVLTKKDFKTLVWTERGLNGLYKKGEKMILNVRSDEDCYIKIYHIDVNGNAQLLFPNLYEKSNRLQAGQVYRIPNDKMKFDFVMSAPYGIETIRLIAQTEQFSDLAGLNLNNGFVPMGNLNEGLTTSDLVKRGIDIRPTVRKSEAGYTYNIVEK